MDARYGAIYDQQAARYDRLVAREDHAGNLWRALDALGIGGGRVVEFGAGTGRLTRWLADRGATVLAFDGAAPMLRLAAEQVTGRVAFAVADNARLPLPDGCADVAIEGWSFGHWADDGADAMVAEMLRVLRPGGRAVIIETLGTGVEAPSVALNGGSPRLAAFYAQLEQRHGFTRQVVRTDYRFADHAEAVELAGFFFGDGMVERVRDAALPECTGVWTAITPSDR
ncbi:MAG: class I SAM-dependent methyltransferase [Myxococcales bacterium]|nr:class I SAM-dependent methyltransferase [Myxococcales bacterium]